MRKVRWIPTASPEFNILEQCSRVGAIFQSSEQQRRSSNRSWQNTNEREGPTRICPWRNSSLTNRGLM